MIHAFGLEKVKVSQTKGGRRCDECIRLPLEKK